MGFGVGGLGELVIFRVGGFGLGGFAFWGGCCGFW